MSSELFVFLPQNILIKTGLVAKLEMPVIIPVNDWCLFWNQFQSNDPRYGMESPSLLVVKC